MVAGHVVFSLLTSCLITGLTVRTVDNNVKLYGMKVAALHDSPEYHLAVRRNAQVNKVRNYTSVEDIKEDLLSGKVKGALIDTYVAAARKDLFDNESIVIHELIDYRSSFGIVLGGNSVRLQHCFLDYLKQDKSLLTSLVENYTDTLQRSKVSIAEQEATGMFDSSETVYQVNLIVLSAILAAALLCGVLYELCRRRMNRVHDKEISTILARKEKLIQEMRLLLAEFHSRVSTRYVALTRKHRKERKLVLSRLMKERKPYLSQETRQRAKLYKEEQNAQESNKNKLFLEDTSLEAFHSL